MVAPNGPAAAADEAEAEGAVVGELDPQALASNATAIKAAGARAHPPAPARASVAHICLPPRKFSAGNGGYCGGRASCVVQRPAAGPPGASLARPNRRSRLKAGTCANVMAPPSGSLLATCTSRLRCGRAEKSHWREPVIMGSERGWTRRAPSPRSPPADANAIANLLPTRLPGGPGVPGQPPDDERPGGHPCRLGTPRGTDRSLPSACNGRALQWPSRPDRCLCNETWGPQPGARQSVGMAG